MVSLVGGAVLLYIYAPSVLPGLQKHKTPSGSMLFVGDVMLARHVETLMRGNGIYYPFKGIRDLLAEYTRVVGNFEGSIQKVHTQTPDLTFQFSAMSEVAVALARSGFTDMTLANNHSYDYGREAYAHTRTVLTDAGITVGGNPLSVSDDDVLYNTIGDVRVAIIPMHATVQVPALADVQGILSRASKQSDIQIVSIHWGEEYALDATDLQRTFAHALIDAGADAIIGHHPHVVETIEEYRGAPIFYSLGNFIFDQYWDTNVQEGLTVGVSFVEHAVHYSLIPITSLESKSAPRPMTRIERTQFLDALAARSQASLADPIRSGKIVELFTERITDSLQK